MLARPVYRVGLTQWQTLCVENYLRAKRLERACNKKGELALALNAHTTAHIQITQQGPYTVDMAIEVHHAHPVLPPVLIALRLYHDMRMAEVISLSQDSQALAQNKYPNSRMHQPDEKWQWNFYLSEWLRHLSRYGKVTNFDQIRFISRSAS